MKRMKMMLFLLIGTSGTVMAQTDKNTLNNNENNTTEKKEVKGTKVDPGNLDQRNIYYWKSGQRATPTGHEATGLGGGYAALQKDSGVIIRKHTNHRSY